jgi:hypothetical protein
MFGDSVIQRIIDRMWSTLTHESRVAYVKSLIL